MESPFPLKLSTIERFFSLDDQPDHPNQIVCRLRIKGIPDRTALQEALNRSALDHPMINAKLAVTGSKAHWVTNDQPHPAFHWIDDAPTDANATGEFHRRDFPSLQPLDLRRGIASNLTVVVDGEYCDVILQTHHAAMDGLGGMQAIGDVLIHYGKLVDASSRRKLKVRRSEPSRLHERHRSPHSLWSRIKVHRPS